MRRPPALAALAAAALAALASACGGGGQAAPGTTVTQSTFPAPALSLHDVNGRRVTGADLRGHPTVVAFVYTHCRNTCPLMLQALALDRRDLGAAGRRLRIVAVSVDPKGDTPAAVRSFLQRRQLTGVVRYLIGSPAELHRTWAAWHVFSVPDPKHPEQREHTAAIYGIDAGGRVQWVHAAEPLDPPLLLRRVTRLVNQTSS